jgi:hypothetical protein
MIYATPPNEHNAKPVSSRHGSQGNPSAGLSHGALDGLLANGDGLPVTR